MKEFSQKTATTRLNSTFATLLAAISSVLLAALLVMCATARPALADTAEDTVNTGNTTSETIYIRDHYNLLSTNEWNSLENKAEQLSDTYQCDVYLTILDNINGYDVRQYAEAYWDYFELGRGANQDGIMFLFAVDSRDYVTITHGQGKTGGITIFTDYGIERIEDAVVSELKNDNWERACEVYLNEVSDIFAFYKENGEPFDIGNDPEAANTAFVLKVVATIVIPLLITGGLCFMWARQMKTARLKKEAGDYLDHDSFVLTNRQDIYLTTTRNVVKIEKHESSGGSSVSSSGFGGSSGGKF